MKLWPPCGLVGSSEALRALGTLPNSLTLETLDEPKLEIKGNVQSCHKSINASNTNMELQTQHANKNTLCEVNAGSTPLRTQSIVVNGNKGTSKLSPDQRPISSVASCTASFVERYLPGNGLRAAPPTESIASPFPTIVKPISLDQPKTGRTGDFNTQDAINRAFIGKPTEKAAESLQVVFGANSFPRILEGNSVIDAKAAAEVAALANTVIGSNSEVTNSIFNGYYHQPPVFNKEMAHSVGNSSINVKPINIISKAASSAVGPRQINACMGTPISSTFSQQLLSKSESGHTSLANGLDQPQSSVLDLKCPPKSPTNSDPAKDPQFVTSNIAVSVQKKDNITINHIAPAVVQNAPVKATTKPSVLLKKFG